ncbi:MAG: serine/threonine protein kinase, partial [Planctomycetes bacterium]|nr:serine/threonine protein kinase [Planctomycetota bacterium]
TTAESVTATVGGPGRQRFVPPAPAELAAAFPQLEVLELIGQGGMGAVYRARQKHLDRVVALKVLAPDLGRDAAFVERFAREARALARLNHPHLVSIYDFGQTGEWCWIVMEHVDGANLRQVMATGALSPAQALAIVPQLCEALQYAHDEGVVHRDIKPENILMDRKGRVKVADFGLAKLMSTDAGERVLTASHDVMGTVHYMAPEQVERSRDVDHRADIYSLGVVLYEMLTGGLPLGRFDPPSKRVAVDVRLDEVVLKALEKDPQRRYQQASEVQTDVDRIASGHPIPSTSAPGPDEAHRDSILLQLLAVFVAGAAIAAAVHRHDGAAGAWMMLPCLIAAAICAWGGWRLMRGDEQWGWAAKLSAVAMIPLLIAADDNSPWALMPIAAVLYLGRRRIHDMGTRLQQWGHRQQEFTRRGRAANAPAAPPVATGASAAATTVPAPAGDGLGWPFAVMLIAMVIPTSIAAWPSATRSHDGQAPAPSIATPDTWMLIAVGAVVAIAGAALFILFRRGRTSPANAAAMHAPSPFHAVISGFFHLLAALILCATLVALSTVALVAYRPDLIPVELRAHLRMDAPGQPPTERPEPGTSPAPASH